MKHVKILISSLCTALLCCVLFISSANTVMSETSVWKLVTDVTTLSTNDNIVFVSEGYAMGAQAGSGRNRCQVEMQGDEVVITDGVTIFTVTAASQNTFNFKTGDYYLGRSKRSLVESATVTSWSVNITDSSSNVYINSNGKSYYIFDNGSSYGLSTNKKDILIYKAETYAEPDQLNVESISLAANSIELEVGQKETMNYNIYPNDATNQAVSWVSNDSTVAKVDTNGTITAVSEGETTITATTEDGQKTDSVTVIVDAPFVPADQKTLSDFTSTDIDTKTHYDFNFGEYYGNGGAGSAPTIDGMKFGTNNVTTGSAGVTFGGTSLFFFTIYSGSVSNSEAFSYAIKTVKVYGINSNSMTVYGANSAAGSTTTISSSSSGAYTTTAGTSAKYYVYDFSSYDYKYFKVNANTFYKTGIYRIEVELKDDEIVETKNKIETSIAVLETAASLNLAYLLYEDNTIEIDEVYLKYAVTCITKEEYENLTKLYSSVKVGFTYTIEGKEYTITDKDNAFSFDEKEINGKTFYLFIITFYDFPKDMNYYRTNITCQAFFELDGKRINMVSKTTSVYELTRYYINNYNFALEHTNEALKVLKSICEQ